MSPQSTAFFFVPGAFCPGTYFHKVVDELRSQGYYARALDLPSMDTKLKEKGELPGLYADATYVREAILGALDHSHESKNVVLVASSYGGAVAFEACKGITAEERRETRTGQDGGGILKHLVLLGSLLAEPGPTAQELVGAPIPDDPETNRPVSHINALDTGLAGAVLCGSLPKEKQEYYGAMGKAISAQAFLEPLTFAAFEKVPTTLVIGAKDLALPPEKQHEYFDKAVERGVNGLRKVIVEDGDHLTMLSNPEVVVKVCLDAAGDA
jgi:pimeloyl-ACP methyl ester carboxylesterase